MRDRRLLTLAVLVVALGFSTAAQAGDTAVVTLVEGAGTFDVSLRLWNSSGVGVDSTSGGLLDFALENIAVTGDYLVTSAVNAAPQGEVADVSGAAATTGVAAGFVAPRFDNSPTKLAGRQPVSYQDPNGATPTLNVPLNDAAVLGGVGISGYTAGGSPSNGMYWTDGGDPGTYAADAPIASGTFSGGAGTLEVDTFGLVSFSVLPDDPFVGPLGTSPLGVGAFGDPVTGIIVQTTAMAGGNDGGKALSTATTILRVDAGTVTLGGSYASGTTGDSRVANVTLRVADPNVAVNFGGTGTHVFAALDIQQGNEGTQDVDIYDARLNVYSTNLAAAQIAIEGMLGTGDGLYSSQVDLANEVLVVTQADDDDADSDVDHVAVVATIIGDINLDRTVDFFDLGLLTASSNWQSATGLWTRGDLNHDDTVDFFDLGLLTASSNWQASYTASGGVVPEPATLTLLCLGAVGVLRRRRK